MADTQCDSCGADIVWKETEVGGWMPVEPHNSEQLEKDVFDPEHHTSHFENCPDADDFRSGGDAEYKYIRIEQSGEHNEKPLYQVSNKKNGNTLAVIFYHPEWKKYVLNQSSPDAVFSSGCLKNIVKFIEELSDA
jgi:hypothetical protein